MFAAQREEKDGNDRTAERRIEKYSLPPSFLPTVSPLPCPSPVLPSSIQEKKTVKVWLYLPNQCTGFECLKSLIWRCSSKLRPQYGWGGGERKEGQMRCCYCPFPRKSNVYARNVDSNYMSTWKKIIAKIDLIIKWSGLIIKGHQLLAPNVCMLMQSVF